MLALITATRNSMATLPAMLESASDVLADAKSVFIDGDSTDGTTEFLQAHTADNPQAILLRQDGEGLYAALNQGVSLAMHDSDVSHIGMLHSDDRVAGDSYLEYLSVIDSSSADIFYADIEYHDEPGNVVRRWRSGSFSRLKLTTGWMPPHTSVVVSKDVYKEVGLYDPTFGTSADYEWLVRVLDDPHRKTQYFPRCVVSMLVGGASNATLRARLQANRQDGRVWTNRSRVQGIAIRILKPMRKIGQYLSASGS
jgi:glycosyltransferase